MRVFSILDEQQKPKDILYSDCIFFLSFFKFYLFFYYLIIILIQAMRIFSILDEQQKPKGLYPIMIDAETGHFTKTSKWYERLFDSIFGGFECMNASPPFF